MDDTFNGSDMFKETSAHQGSGEEFLSAEPIARQLEYELMRVRAQLRAAVEQYEIQTEELRASNEEFQAMNEELTTVNQELKVKIEELSQANNDFQNLMNSTDIGTLFLDRSMRVKLFTPRARDLFNLIPADTGRSLLDITSRLSNEGLLSDVEGVLDTLLAVEREVETREGSWYLMRALPYRTTEDRIEGVVVTFLDITGRKRSEELLRASEERLRLLVESIEDFAIFSMDTEGRIQSWNVGAERTFGYTENEAIGRHTEIIFTPEDRARAIPGDEMRRAGAHGRAMDERWHIRKDGSRFYASGVLSPLRDSVLTGYVKVARDLTAQMQAAEQLRLAHEELEGKVQDRTQDLAEANKALLLEVAERRQVEEMRAQLLRQLVTAQEDERRRISRDLHDQMGQQLTALRLRLETLKNRVDGDAESSAQVEQTQAIALQLESDVDFLAWELRPAALDDIGLKETLEVYVRNWSEHFDIPTEFHSAGFDKQRLAPEIETNLYRIAQEALNNIFKHARSSRVDVMLERRDHQVVLIIEDDGVGIDYDVDANVSEGMGLTGIRERASLIGGALEIESAPDEGTTLFVRAPALFVDEGES
jgi:PAS domain S-box-containing protein